METSVRNTIPANNAVALIKTRDWGRISQDLDAQGSALLERILSADECQALADLYPEDGLFRSHVVMARHGFGRGEYKYFSYPLPEIIAGLRTTLYPRLAPIAIVGTPRWASRSAIRRRTLTSLGDVTMPGK